MLDDGEQTAAAFLGLGAAAASRPPSAARSADSSTRARRRRRSSRSLRCGYRARWSYRAASRTGGRSRRDAWCSRESPRANEFAGAPRSALSASRRTGPRDGAREQERQHDHDAGGDQEHLEDCEPLRRRPCRRYRRLGWKASARRAPARKRCTGTATETITSARSLMRTMLDLRPMQRMRDLLVALAVLRPEFAIGRQIAAAEPAADRQPVALEVIRLAPRRRRQIEAQHVDRDCGCRESARRRGRRCARACWSATPAAAAPARPAPD